MKSEKDWRKIRNVRVKTEHYTGPVLNRTRHVEINTFDTLEEAVTTYSNYIYGLFNRDSWSFKRGWSFISRQTKRHVYIDAWNNPPEFRDELGLIIPLWKICEAYESKRYVPRSYEIERSHYAEDGKLYRNGVVPRTGNRRRRWGRGWYRRPQTNQEIREGEFLWYDEDAKEYGIEPRRRRGRDELPNWWDDIHRSDVRDRCWKTQRRTQWR